MNMKSILVTLVLASITFLAIRPAQTTDQSLYWMKIRATDKFQRSVIANSGVSIEITKPDFVIAVGNTEELHRIEKLGWLEASYALTAETDFPRQDAAYHNYTELTQALQALQASAPGIVELKSLGKTRENRDIWAIHISGDLANSAQLPGIIYMGGHHAREHLSVELPLMFAQHLVDQYKAGDKNIKALVDHRDINIIPAVNPDGLEYDIASGSYRMWRKNRAHNADGTYGVDLNRNYGFGWGTGGSSTDGSSEVYMGPAPFSEPETQAIKKFVDNAKNTTILLSFHTYSELILYPWGHKYDGIEVARDKAVHEKMAQRMAQWNGYTPEQSSELYIASGDTTDWSYGEHKIISFTFELDPTDSWGGGGFYPGAGVIQPVFQKNLQPALYLLDLADNPYRAIDSTDPLQR